MTDSRLSHHCWKHSAWLRWARGIYDMCLLCITVVFRQVPNVSIKHALSLASRTNPNAVEIPLATLYLWRSYWQPYIMFWCRSWSVRALQALRLWSGALSPATLHLSQPVTTCTPSQIQVNLSEASFGLLAAWSCALPARRAGECCEADLCARTAMNDVSVGNWSGQ